MLGVRKLPGFLIILLEREESNAEPVIDGQRNQAWKQAAKPAFFLRGPKGNVELSINSIGDFLGILFRPPGAAIKTDKPITQDNINFKDFVG